MLWAYGDTVALRFWVSCFTGFRLYVLTGSGMFSSSIDD